MIHLLGSPWIPAVILLLVTCGARLTSESWLAPSAFAGLAWSVYILVPLVVAPEFPMPSLGVWVLLSLIVSIQVGAWLTVGEARHDQGIRVAAALSAVLFRRMQKVVIVSAVVATLCAGC